MAACSIANIVKSLLDPVGLDKMLVDDIGDVTVTNDGATILRLLEVEHPAVNLKVLFSDDLSKFMILAEFLLNCFKFRMTKLAMKQHLLAKVFWFKVSKIL